MKVFISWSGEISRDVASLLNNWIGDVIHGVDCWYSPEAIEKGSMWFSEIGDGLDENNIGILCITPDNTAAPWILFEAGALFKGLSKSRVCPLLVGNLKPSDIKPPLSHFNLTLPVKEDMLRLMHTINSIHESPLTEERLVRSFERCWPEFEKTYNDIDTENPRESIPERPPSDLLEEILDGIRHIQRTLPITTSVQGEYSQSVKSPAVSAAQDFDECTEFHQKGHLVLRVLRNVYIATGSGKFAPEMNSIPYVNAKLESFPDGYSREKIKIVCNTGTTFDFNISLRSIAINEPVPLGDYVFGYEAVAQ